MIAIPKPGRRRKSQVAEPSYLPTLEQIAQHMESIRDSWTFEEEVDRTCGTSYLFLTPKADQQRLPSVREDFDTCDNDWWMDQIGARE